MYDVVLKKLSARRKYPAPVFLSKDKRRARTKRIDGMIAGGAVVGEITIAAFSAKPVVGRDRFKESRFSGTVFPGEETNT